MNKHKTKVLIFSSNIVSMKSTFCSIFLQTVINITTLYLNYAAPKWLAGDEVMWSSLLVAPTCCYVLHDHILWFLLIFFLSLLHQNQLRQTIWRDI